MPFQLKKGQESFTPVEGPFAKKQFAPGQTYSEIPPNEERRFEEIKPAPAAKVKIPAPSKNAKAAEPAGGHDAVMSPEKGGKL